MKTGETEAFATRLSTAEATRVRDAVDQTGLSRSGLLARALRYYVEENPDEIRAFHSGDSDTGPLEQAGILPAEPESDQTGIEEP